MSDIFVVSLDIFQLLYPIFYLCLTFFNFELPLPSFGISRKFYGCLIPFPPGGIYIAHSHLLFLFLDNFNHQLVKMCEINETAPASPAPPNAPSTKLTLVAERLLRRPDRFERLYKKHLDALNGPRRLELMLEISNLTQERGEVAGFSASVRRKIIEGWKAEDYEEMGVDKAEV